MAAVKQWLLGLLLVTFAGELAGEITPKGRQRGGVRLVSGLLLLLTILQPLRQLGGFSLDMSALDLSEDVAAQTEIYQNQQDKSLSAIIAERTAAYIWDKACEMGVSCQVEVYTEMGESGIPLPCAAVIRGQYSPDLERCVEEEVGIPAHRQTWLEVE